MTDTTSTARSASEPPQAVVSKRRGISIVWLIPLVALLIGAFLGYRAYISQGPTITIGFETAEGLEAGKTKIRYLDVVIGTVDAVDIAPDLKTIVVTASMVPGAADYLREQTRFWIVKPRIGVGGVSGLGTLLSGAYIGLAPGEGEAARHFTGLEDPPPISANVPGRKFVLTAGTLGSVNAGTPIYYRGIDIGQVLGYKLSKDARALDVDVFVKEPYEQLVRTNSRFWNTSGINVAAGASGIEVQIASLQSLLIGGIEFDTPYAMTTGSVAPEGTRFELFPSQQAVTLAQYTQKIPFLVFFDSSVRGLNPGAPVEFRGIRVGSVTEVRLEFSQSNEQIRIPVTIEIEPQRLIAYGADPTAAPEYSTMAKLVQRGLRAQLQSGNLLTGDLFVDLTMVPDAPPAELDRSGPIPILPSVPATLEALQASATAILNKIANLPLEKLVGSLSETADGLQKIVNSPGVQDGVRTLADTLAQLQKTIDEVGNSSAPLLASFRDAATSATSALKQAQVTMASVQRTIGSDSALATNAEAMMQELSRAARSIRVFADYLDRHPEALIRGKSGQGGQ